MKALALLLLLACIALSFAAQYTTRTVDEDIDAVRNYWTEERMREAVDRDILAQEDIAEPFDEPFADATPVDATEPVTEPGQDSKFFPTTAFNNNNTESQHGKRYPFPFTSAYAPSYTSYPWRAVGKVFFTLGGSNFVCSAVVLRQNVVHTAGHCVFDPSIGFATNFIFVPGYNNGAQPYGAWGAFQIYIPTDWQLYGSFCRDYAVVVIRKNNGAAIGDVVGYLGYMYNAPYAQTWRALGYPAVSPFGGQLNYYADSNLGVQDTRCGGRCNAGGIPASIGIGSDATGGTSGGPWVVGWGSTNYLNGVNSYKYTAAQPRAIYGPYFDQAWFNFVNPSFSITPP